MLKVGVLVSGGGTNLQAIIDKKEAGYLPNVELDCVVSSSKEAYALKRAAQYDINTICVERKAFNNSEEYSRELLKVLKDRGVEIIVLAGFMYILSTEFIEAYENKIINVHPSLIPSFCGKGYYGLVPHQKALEYGVIVTGATVHFVEAECDAGPIILQRAVYINDNDTAETLQKRVMEEAEWEILPEALKLISEKQYEVKGRKVIFYD